MKNFSSGSGGMREKSRFSLTAHAVSGRAGLRKNSARTNHTGAYSDEGSALRLPVYMLPFELEHAEGGK